VTSSSYGGGPTTTVVRKTYVPSMLPPPPAHGSTEAHVRCRECSDTYQVRIDSEARRLVNTSVKWVLFPLLVLAAMIVPGLMGRPDSWIIYFLIVVTCWIIFGRHVGKQGYGRPKRLTKKAPGYAEHRLFALKK
jgi:hypothetical protein